MTADDIPTYQGLLQKLQSRRFDDATPEERQAIIRLSFAYIEPRHRFGLLTDELMAKIVSARKQFHQNIPDDLAALIERYDPEHFISSASLMDNVLFGRIAYQQADASDRIRAIMGDLFDSLDLFDDVLSIGLEFDVGSGGKRLTMAQRQKLNLARALIRRSDYFVFNRPLSALDQRLQDQITHNIVRGLHKEGERPGIIWVLSNAKLAEIFDRILLFDRGTLVEAGNFPELSEQNGMFKELLS
jgi:putative ABC transport system ATP-binding protein